MDTIFMNSSNNVTCDRHRHILNRPDKVNLKRNDNMFSIRYLRLL